MTRPLLLASLLALVLGLGCAPAACPPGFAQVGAACVALEDEGGASDGGGAADAGRDASIDGGRDAGPPIRCIELPPEGGRVTADFSIPATLQIVDVMFLIDATGSMRDEIDNVRAGLRDVVVPGLELHRVPTAPLLGWIDSRLVEVP